MSNENSVGIHYRDVLETVRGVGYRIRRESAE